MSICHHFAPNWTKPWVKSIATLVSLTIFQLLQVPQMLIYTFHAHEWLDPNTVDLQSYGLVTKPIYICIWNIFLVDSRWSM